MADFNALLTASGIYRGSRSPYLSAMAGDSRVANATVSPSDPEKKYAKHPVIWAAALSGQRVRNIYNGGNSGKRSDEWQLLTSLDPGYVGVNNIDAMLSTKALWAIFCGSAVNDLTQSISADAIWTGYNGAPGLKAIFDRTIAAGMRPVIFTEPGGIYSSNAALKVPETNKLNRYIRSYCRANPQCVMIDVAAIVWDSTSTVSNQITQKAGFYADGIHFLCLGAQTIGEILASVWLQLVPAQSRLVCAQHEVKANGGVQFHPNPLLLATSAAPTVTGFTFNTVTPTGITFVRRLNGTNGSGAATAVVDLITDPNGYGKALRIAATFTQIGEDIQFDMPLDLTSSLLAGDQLFANYHCEVANGSSNAAAPVQVLRVVADGTNYEEYDLYNDYAVAAAMGPAKTTAYNIDSETGYLTVPAFTAPITAGIHRNRLVAMGAGTITATYSRFGVHKVIS